MVDTVFKIKYYISSLGPTKGLRMINEVSYSFVIFVDFQKTSILYAIL